MSNSCSEGIFVDSLSLWLGFLLPARRPPTGAKAPARNAQGVVPHSTLLPPPPKRFVPETAAVTAEVGGGFCHKGWPLSTRLCR